MTAQGNALSETDSGRAPEPPVCRGHIPRGVPVRPVVKGRMDLASPTRGDIMGRPMLSHAHTLLQSPRALPWAGMFCPCEPAGRFHIGAFSHWAHQQSSRDSQANKKTSASPRDLATRHFRDQQPTISNRKSNRATRKQTRNRQRRHVTSPHGTSEISNQQSAIGIPIARLARKQETVSAAT